MDINSQDHIRAIAPKVTKAYQFSKEQKYDEAYHTLLPVFEAKEMPTYFEEVSGWAIYRYIKCNEKKLSSTEIRRALSYYLDFASCKPSLMHTCIMRLAVNLEKNHENEFKFIEFCRMWKLESLRDDDFLQSKVDTNSGKSIELQSLAENVATRLYKELKSRHTEVFVNDLFPFFLTIKQKCPDNRFIGMYIAQLYFWQNNVEKAKNEYKNILRTTPEWFIWKHLGDICEDTGVKISMYCKALTMMGKDEYIGELRLSLAKLLMDTNKEHAAYEVEQYMKTYKEKGWKISSEAYMLQSKLQGVTPSAQAKQFYRDNTEEAENFAYSDIPAVELTYIGVETNHAGKEKAKLVNKQKKILIHTSLTQQLKKASVGDVFLVRVFENQKRKIALTIHAIGKKNVQSASINTAKQGKESDVCTVRGVVSFPAQGDFCFIDHQYYVPEKLTKANNLKTGDTIKAKAKKMPDGRWRVVSIING